MKARDQVIENDYKRKNYVWRPEFQPIIDWINPNSKVLDAGCGVGVLGETLIKQKNCDVHGIELLQSVVDKAKKRGIKAKAGDLDLGLEYEDNSFDYVILCD
ncbi:MAG: methionine biosynthesis protein MetW, partial [Candidatus Hodarchaeota archaeon]